MKNILLTILLLGLNSNLIHTSENYDEIECDSGYDITKKIMVGAYNSTKTFVSAVKLAVGGVETIFNCADITSSLVHGTLHSEDVTNFLYYGSGFVSAIVSLASLNPKILDETFKSKFTKISAGSISVAFGLSNLYLSYQESNEKGFGQQSFRLTSSVISILEGSKLVISTIKNSNSKLETHNIFEQLSV